MRVRLFTVFVAITVWLVALEANTCAAAKSVKVAGPLGGRVFYTDGSSVPDVGLRVLNKTSAIAADVKTDSKADFLFPPLGKGKYRLTTTSASFNIAFGDIEITSSDAAICKRSLPPND